MTERISKQDFFRRTDALSAHPGYRQIERIGREALVERELAAWATMSAKFLSSIRYARLLGISEWHEECFDALKSTCIGLERAANYFFSRENQIHKFIDSALTDAYWHLLGPDCDFDLADHFFRRSGRNPAGLEPSQRKHLFSMEGLALAESLMDGVGISIDGLAGQELFMASYADLSDGQKATLEIQRLTAKALTYGKELGASAGIAATLWEDGYLPAEPMARELEKYRGLEDEGDEPRSVKRRQEKPRPNRSAIEIQLKKELGKLNDMIGLASVKAEVEGLVALEKVRLAREQKGIISSQAPSRHLVLTGNPGTGKTTVARILAHIYYLLAISRAETFIETDRSDLVGGYLGQTAIKTKEVIESALGGTLFIDEAYSLAAEQDSYGDEAINTLLKAMEDHRSDLIVIAAGYTNEMQRFLESNPGLRSRFNTTLHFEDYSSKERIEILTVMAAADGNRLDEAALRQAEAAFAAAAGSREAEGNARFVRNFYEKCVKKHAARLAAEHVDLGGLPKKVLSTITCDDVLAVCQEIRIAVVKVSIRAQQAVQAPLQALVPVGICCLNMGRFR